MDQPRRSRSVGYCKVLLIRYRVVFILCFLLLVLYWRRQRADRFNTSTGIDEVGAPIIDVAQQQVGKRYECHDWPTVGGLYRNFLLSRWPTYKGIELVLLGHQPLS